MIDDMTNYTLKSKQRKEVCKKLAGIAARKYKISMAIISYHFCTVMPQYIEYLWKAFPKAKKSEWKFMKHPEK